MLTEPRNQTLIMGSQIGLTLLLVAADLVTPVGWPTSGFFVIVVAASMWLPGARPIFWSAFGCTILTVLAWFWEYQTGPLDLDALNRITAVVVIWVVAVLCALFKRAERKARELAAIVESSPDAIYSKNLDGAITSWNAGAEMLFGYAPQEAVGRHASLVTRSNAPGDYAQVVDAIRHGKRAATLETVFMRKDGSPVPVSLSASAVRDDHGKLTEIAFIARDVTKRKLADQELQDARDAARAASRAKSEFLASMSHEIRTPMNGVLGMLELALDTGLSPEQRHYVERAHASADLLLRIINDILDFSKIEAGHLELAPEPFSLRENLGELIKAFGPRADRKGLELALDVDRGASDALIGDALRLDQVLTNVLGNAIKFTDRGEVVLKVWEDSASHPGSADMDEARLHFSVTDTGPGIAREKQDLIFSAFTQADSSATRRFGGTGLGLTISARLVELMGGRIWVESEPGKGSTFRFTARFGLHREPLSAVVRDPPDIEGLPVLAADDNATNRHILADMLTNWRMRPTMAVGGREALAKLKDAAGAGNAFPLVLLDAVMPDMDGFAVAEEIKRDHALAGAIIMMLTSADRAGELARCRRLGIAAYLRKPIKQSELLNALLNALGRSARTAGALPAVAEPAASTARRGLRVLVVEDNEFNQELAVKLLTRWGHTAVLAADGEQALAAWDREAFDLILMDVQLPGMDGFAVTEAIRDRERTQNAHVPIIALTAHALKGDRERCLAAGMDAYVSKPIRTAELADTIAGLLPADDDGEKAASATSGVPEAGYDPDAALAAFNGDRSLLLEMAATFCRQCPAMLEQIRRAVERGDGVELARTAHKFTGALGTFNAQAAYQAGLQLEALGQAADTAAFGKMYARFAEAVESVRQVLARLGDAEEHTMR